MTLPEDNQIYKGEFYLMDRPEVKHNGILTVNQKGNAVLELFGSFETPSPAIDQSSYTIWGRSHEGDTVSLLSCSRKQRKTRFGVSDVDIWHTPFILLGAHVADLQLPYFTEIKLEIDGFREWVGKDGGETSFNFDYTTLGYAYQEPAPISFTINDALSGTIFFKNEFWVGLDYKSQAEQKTWLSLKTPKKISLNQLMIEARKFRKLLSFFIGQKVRIKRMIFYSADHLIKVINPSKDHVPERQPVELFFDDNEIYRELPGRSVYYINFDDIEANFEPVTQKWFSMVDSGLAPVTDLMLQGITDHYFYDDADFLRAWQGVEAFHRIIIQDTPALIKDFNSWFNKLDEYIPDPEILKNIKMRLGKAYETSARNRLKFVIKENLAILNLKAPKKQIDLWIREIIESRNYLTHLDPESVSKKADSQHLFNYTGLLKALLMVMIFKELQIDEELLKRVGSHTTFNLRGLLKIGNNK